MSDSKGINDLNNPYDSIRRHAVSSVTKVPREKVLTTIITDQFRLVGYIHIDPNHRITDFLSAAVSGMSNRFLPVTAVKAYPITGNDVLFETPFLAVRLNTINILYPLEEVKK